MLETDGKQVRLTVTDNGVGIPDGGRRSGLTNMAERAQKLGGGMDLESPGGKGTRLVWHAPLADSPDRAEGGRSAR